MADDLIQTLTRFHREVVMPDVREALQTEVGSLRGEMLSRFDELYRRLDRLETEYHALVAVVRIGSKRGWTESREGSTP